MFDIYLTLRSIVAKARAWQERQRVMSELYALDDRSLSDIGLQRGDIAYVFADQMTSAPATARTEVQPANANLRRAA
jgi:uncharacterized protein YjiS (DUF1127 family)